MPIIANPGGLNVGSRTSILTNSSGKEILVYNERAGIWVNSTGASELKVQSTGEGTSIGTIEGNSIILKTIVGGPNVTVTSDDNSVYIKSNQAVANSGNGVSVVQSQGDTLTMKTLVSGSGVTVVDNGDTVTINSNTVSNVTNSGNGVTLASQQNSDIVIKSIVNGSNVTVVDNGDTVEINSLQEYTNTGGGHDLVSTNGTSLNVKTLKAGSGLTIADDGQSITLEFGGSLQAPSTLVFANMTELNQSVVSSICSRYRQW